MKLLKKRKGWGIYQHNKKEIEEYGFPISVIHPDNMECYSSCLTPSDSDIECDSVESAVSWIDNY